MNEKERLKAMLEETEQITKQHNHKRQLLERGKVFARALDLCVIPDSRNTTIEIARTLIVDLQAYCEHVGRTLDLTE